MAVRLADWLFSETLNVPFYLEIVSFITQKKPLPLKGAGGQLNLCAVIPLRRARGSDEPALR